MRPGAVTGFLGPNGAGKSTTMRMVLGLDAPDRRARSRSAGRRYAELPAPLRDGRRAARRRCGPPRAERPRTTCGPGGGRTASPRRRVDEVLDEVGLAAVADRGTAGFSLGMRQRLGIAAALLGDPEVLCSTSRSTGSTPRASAGCATCCAAWRREGRTVFVSSHLMAEMQRTADHLIVIGRGRLLADTPMDEFIRTRSRPVTRVRSGDPERLASALVGAGASPPRRGRRRLGGVRAERRGGRRPRRPRGRGAARADPARLVARGRLHGHDRREHRVPGRERCLLTPHPTVAPALARAVRAEVVKATSTRSLRWTLLACALVMPVLAVFVGLTESLQPDDTVLGGSLTGAPLAQLVAGAFGVIVVTGEYSTGTIRPTCAAVPRRGTVLAAKALLVGSSVAAAGLASAAAAFGLGSLLLGGDGRPTGEPFPALLGVAGGLAALAVLGVGAGVLLRHSAGAVAAVVGVALVPALVAPALGPAERWVAGASPTSGLEKMTQTSDAAPDVVGSLGAWPSLALVVGYTAACCAGAAVTLLRRDV